MGKDTRNKYLANKDFTLPKGSCGFLLTCRRGKERPAAKESISLLEDFRGEDGDVPIEKSTENIEKDWEKELQELKEKKNDEFGIVDTKLDCLVFITSKSIKPVEFIHDLLSDFLQKGVRRTQYCSRILPVETTCQATIKEIEVSAKSLIEPYFKSHKGSYAIASKIRNNSKVNRDELIKTIADLGKLITNVVPTENKVDLKNADVTILIEIIHTVAMISIIKDYEKLKRLNIDQLITPENALRTNISRSS